MARRSRSVSDLHYVEVSEGNNVTRINSINGSLKTKRVDRLEPKGYRIREVATDRSLAAGTVHWARSWKRRPVLPVECRGGNLMAQIGTRRLGRDHTGLYNVRSWFSSGNS